MRRRLAVPLLAAALLLPAACGGGDGDTTASESSEPSAGSAGSESAPPRKTDSDAKLPEITAGKKFGEDPTVEVDGDPPPDVRFSVVSEGDGPEVKAGDLLVADYKARAWEVDGEKGLVDNSFSGEPLVKSIGKGEITKGWDDKIPGVKVGSRVLLVEPAEVEGDLAGKTLVFVIDILGAVDPKAGAEGEEVKPDKGLPEVSGKTDPEITIPEGEDPSKDLVAQILLRGKGPEVKEGEMAVVHYTGVLWRNGKQFDSSWDRDGGPVPLNFEIGTASIIKAWNEGLKGKPVGSRVLLVVPPALGYGPEGQKAAGIEGTDTMVFVVDILGSF